MIPIIICAKVRADDKKNLYSLAVEENFIFTFISSTWGLCTCGMNDKINMTLCLYGCIMIVSSNSQRVSGQSVYEVYNMHNEK